MATALWETEAQPVPDGSWWQSIAVPCQHRFCVDAQLEVCSISLTPVIPVAQRQFIESVVCQPERWLELAEQFVLQELARDPEVFGWNAAQAAAACRATTSAAWLGEASLIFWQDESWAVHFRQGSFPIGDPYGLLVLFTGVNPTGIEDLSNAEPL